MSQSKALRLPVSLLQKGDSASYCLFCLPSGGRDILLSMAHRMLWDIYVDGDGARVQLSDAERAIIDATIEGLIMGCEFPDYSEELNALAEAIANISLSVTCAPDVNVTCGDGNNWIVYPDPGAPPVINPGPLPDVPIDPDNPVPPVDGWPDEPLDPDVDNPPFGDNWDTYDADACAAANAVVDAVQKSAARLQQVFVGDVSTLAGIVLALNAVAVGGLALIFSREFIIELARSVWRLYIASSLAEAAGLFGSISEWVNENKQMLVCFLYSHRTGGSDAMNEYIAAAWEFFTGTAMYLSQPTIATAIFRMMFADNTFQTILAAGLAYSPTDPVDCSLCEQSRFIAVPVPDSLFNTAAVTLTRVTIEYFDGELTVTKSNGNEFYPGQAAMGSAVDFAAVLAHYGGGEIVAGCVEILGKSTSKTNDGWTNVPCVNCGTIDLDAAALGITALKVHPNRNTPELSEFLVNRFGSAGSVLAGVPSWNYGTLTLNEPVGTYAAVKLWLVIDTEA